jgi:hypothetical protein
MKELKCDGDSNGSFRALGKACVKGVRLKRGHSIPVFQSANLSRTAKIRWC